MKNFKIPKFWYVIRTPENAKEINEWICNTKKDEGAAFLTSRAMVLETGDYYSIGAGVNFDSRLVGRTELTYEEFLEYIIYKKQPVYYEHDPSLEFIYKKLLQ